MKVLYSNIVLFLLLGTSLPLFSQHLELKPGERFVLSQYYTQDTQTESMAAGGNVSLDIGCSVLVEVMAEYDSLGYELRCRYEDLSLSLFSSNLDITISTETRNNSMIIKYAELLEEKSFTAYISPLGEVLQVDFLDEHIRSLYQLEEHYTNEQDLVIKTLKEAYGEEALVSLFNLTLNVYCDDYDGRCIKNVYYSFNARPATLNNAFYVQPDKDGKRRIQGIGGIAAMEEEIEFEGGSVTTNLTGNQTFDHLYDAESGWLIEGSSRQKIFLKSVFHGLTDMPDGLEVPSLTQTEFSFEGRKITEED